MVDAYRPSGVTEDDFAGLRAREHMLLRFPVDEWDSGLVSAFPRERPPAAVPSPADRARMEAAMRTAPFRAKRAAARTTQDSDDDVWMEQIWACAERSGEDAAVELALTLLGDDRLPEDQEQEQWSGAGFVLLLLSLAAPAYCACS